MRTVLGVLASLLLVAGLATAGDEKPPSTQTNRMTECNAQAREKQVTGDARKQFMSDCLKSHKADGSTTKAPHPKTTEGGSNAQGEKMKACNQEATAKNLHGDERRVFMSACLKGDKKS